MCAFLKTIYISLPTNLSLDSLFFLSSSLLSNQSFSPYLTFPSTLLPSSTSLFLHRHLTFFYSNFLPTYDFSFCSAALLPSLYLPLIAPATPLDRYVCPTIPLFFLVNFLPFLFITHTHTPYTLSLTYSTHLTFYHSLYLVSYSSSFIHSPLALNQLQYTYTHRSLPLCSLPETEILYFSYFSQYIFVYSQNVLLSYAEFPILFFFLSSILVALHICNIFGSGVPHLHNDYIRINLSFFFYVIP